MEHLIESPDDVPWMELIAPLGAEISRLVKELWQQGDTHQNMGRRPDYCPPFTRSCREETRSQDGWSKVIVCKPGATSSPVLSLQRLLNASPPASLLQWTTLSTMTGQ